MSISFESEEIALNKLGERLRRMTDDELNEFGTTIRELKRSDTKIESVSAAIGRGKSAEH